MKERLVVNFHGIGEPPPWADADERRVWCSKANFCSLLDQIPQVSAEMKLPVSITFDDGNASDLQVAAPALLRRGLTASFFVCAGRIGLPGYLDAAQMRSLIDAGMVIGSHGWDHLDWRRLPTARAVQREVVGARDAIAEALGGPGVDSVAVPFGSYDRHVMRAAQAAFATIYTSDGGRAPLAGAFVPRESYTVRWEGSTLRRLAAPRGPVALARQALARAFKRHRGAPPA